MHSALQVSAENSSLASRQERGHRGCGDTSQQLIAGSRSRRNAAVEQTSEDLCWGTCQRCSPRLLRPTQLSGTATMAPRDGGENPPRVPPQWRSPVRGARSSLRQSSGMSAQFPKRPPEDKYLCLKVKICGGPIVIRTHVMLPVSHHPCSSSGNLNPSGTLGFPSPSLENTASPTNRSSTVRTLSGTAEVAGRDGTPNSPDKMGWWSVSGATAVKR